MPSTSQIYDRHDVTFDYLKEQIEAKADVQQSADLDEESALGLPIACATGL